MSKLAFTCDAKDLRPLSSQVLRTTSKRRLVRALDGVLLETTKTKLTATTTDLEISQRMTMKVDGKRGRVLIPAKPFDTILKTFDGDVTVEDAGEHVTLTQGKTVVKVDSLVIEDFPKVHTVDRKAAAAVVMAEPFVEAFSFANTAASKDESRPVLTGIKLELDANRVHMIGTDSYRMAFTWRDAACEKDVLDDGVIVPATSLGEVARLLRDPLAFTEIRLVGAGHVGFTVGDIEIVARKIDGQFPNWRQLVPERYEEIIEVDRQEMRKAVDRMLKIGSAASPMRITLHERDKPDSMILTHKQQDSHEIADEIAAAETLGEPKDGYKPMDLGFNPLFVFDALGAFDTDNISLCTISPLRPSLFRADREDEGFLVMPVRLTS